MRTVIFRRMNTSGRIIGLFPDEPIKDTPFVNCYTTGNPTNFTWLDKTIKESTQAYKEADELIQEMKNDQTLDNFEVKSWYEYSGSFW